MSYKDLKKTCSTCKEEKSILEFCRDRAYSCGYKAQCKKCLLKKKKEWYWKNIEKVRKNRRKWWFSRHKINLKMQNDWKRKNRYRVYCYGLINDQTPLKKEIWEKLVNQPCYYCGEINYTQGIDRVDNEKNYTEENSVSCCYFCNRAKANLTKKSFLNKIKKIYENHKL